MNTKNDYPPLPKGEQMASGTINGKRVELIRYNEADMRAYVDLDRKARAASVAPEPTAALVKFANWLIEAYHSDDGMPEAKEIVREARAALSGVAPEQPMTGSVINRQADLDIIEKLQQKKTTKGYWYE